MADSIYPVMPATLAPERVAVTRRERGDKQRRDQQPAPRRQAAAETLPPTPEQERAADRPKGKRLDISA